jgi:hypothetical protein
MIWAAFGNALQQEIVPIEGDPQSGRDGVSTWNYRQVIDQHVPGKWGILVRYLCRIIRQSIQHIPFEAGFTNMAIKLCPGLYMVLILFKLKPLCSLKAEIYFRHPEL